MVIFHCYVKLPEGMGIEPIKVIEPWDGGIQTHSIVSKLKRPSKHMDVHEMIIPTYT